MSLRYYLTLVIMLFLNMSLAAMENNTNYSITLKNSAEIVVSAAATNMLHKKGISIKKSKEIKSSKTNTEKTNSVASSPNNMHRVFQQN